MIRANKNQPVNIPPELLNDMFRRHSTHGVTYRTLAGEIGCSEVTIWKNFKRLREANGLPVASRPQSNRVSAKDWSEDKHPPRTLSHSAIEKPERKVRSRDPSAPVNALYAVKEQLDRGNRRLQAIAAITKLPYRTIEACKAELGVQ